MWKKSTEARQRILRLCHNTGVKSKALCVQVLPLLSTAVTLDPNTSSPGDVGETWQSPNPKHGAEPCSQGSFSGSSRDK